VIYEYAVDPALVKIWALSREVGLAQYFGLDHRRLLSDVSDDWENQVHTSLLSDFNWNYEDPEYTAARLFLEALLVYLKQGPSRGLKRTNTSWIADALKAHRQEPFHAILTDVPVPGVPEVVTQDVTNRLGDPRWVLPTINVTSKTAAALADQLEPLLRMSRKVVLVDPYFEANKHWYADVLRELLCKAIKSRAAGRPFPSVVVMSGVLERTPGGSTKTDEEASLSVSKTRCEYAKRHLGRYIPKELTIRFQCISKFAGGDEVHNRFLLTDIGGATIPYGSQMLGPDVFDDILPMPQGVYDFRWKQYGKCQGLRVVGDHIDIKGEL
jgi:hypothetical protein